MPEGKSIYDVYAGAGKSMGEYESKLRGVGDVWTDIEYSQKRGALKSQQREGMLDFLQAGTELIATVGGSYAQRAEDISMIEESTGETMKKVTKYGQDWGELKPHEKLFQGKRYQFGEGIMSKGQLGFAAIQAEAGQDIDLGAKKYKAAERKDYWGEYKGPDIFKGKSPFERLKKPKTAVAPPEGEDWQDMEYAAREQSELDKLDQGPGDAGDQDQEPVVQGLGQSLETAAEQVTKVDTGKDVEPEQDIAGVETYEDDKPKSMMDQVTSVGGSMLDLIWNKKKGW